MEGNASPQVVFRGVDGWRMRRRWLVSANARTSGADEVVVRIVIRIAYRLRALGMRTTCLTESHSPSQPWKQRSQAVVSLIGRDGREVQADGQRTRACLLACFHTRAPDVEVLHEMC